MVWLTRRLAKGNPDQNLESNFAWEVAVQSLESYRPYVGGRRLLATLKHLCSNNGNSAEINIRVYV